jgi:hypothetical protein
MNKNTLYILDSESISQNVLDKIKSKKNCFIVCLNHIVQNELQKNDIKTVFEENILEENDYIEIDELTYNISKNWCQNNNLEKHLTFHKINLGLTLQNEIFQNLLKYVHRIFLIEKSIQKFQPELVLTTYDKGILGSIPYKICVSRGIKTEILEELTTRIIENKFDKVNFAINIFGKNLELSVSHNQFVNLKKIYELYANTRYNFSTLLQKEQRNEKSILFLDFNLTSHERLFEKFSENRFNIFCLNNRRPLLWDSKSIQLAKKLEIKKVSLKKIENEIQSEYNSTIKNLNKDFQNNNLESLFTIKKFNFWKSFQTELVDTCIKRFKETMMLIVQIEKFLDSTDIEFVWTLDDWGFDKTIVNICKIRKIPVYLFLAGSLQMIRTEEKIWPLFFAKQRIADKIFLWGENDMQNCIASGIEPDKLTIGGAPKYDDMFLKKTKREEYILILTGGFPSTQHSYFHSVSMIQKFQKLFERTLYEAKKFNKKIIVKRHPTQGPQEIIDFSEIITRIVPEAKILKNADTLELVLNAALIITVKSTVLEESIILEKPVIYLPYLNDDFGIPYAKLDAVIEISDENQIHQTIHDCLFDRNTRQKLQQGRKKFLEKTISFQGNAAKRHVDESLKFSKLVKLN